MEDTPKEPIKEEAKPDENAPRKIMEIYLTKDGKVLVHSGMLADKIACYGFLEAAKDAVREYSKPNIIKGNGYMPNLRNFLGRK